MYFLYRFPFDRLVVERLKNSIPSKFRYFTKPTKAWHIQKDWIEVAEGILEEAFPDLPFCASCRKKGDQCKAWIHLQNLDGWRHRVKPEQGSTKTAEQTWYENVQEEFKHYRETSQQRSNAQDAYDKWSEQQSRGRAGVGGPGYGGGGGRPQGFDTAEEAYRNFRKRQGTQPEGTPGAGPAKERWYDPGRRMRSSKWAMTVLGITALPNQRDLKKLFRHLAMKYHPDRGGDSDKMALINAAKEHLDAFVN